MDKLDLMVLKLKFTEGHDKIMPGLEKSFKVNSTAKFSVVDLASLKVNHVVAAGGPKSPKGGAARDKTRLTQSTGQSIKKGEGKIGGAFTVTPNPPFLTDRVKYYEKLAAKQAEKLAAKPRRAITITLPDGSTKPGVAWETTPYDVAASIAQGLADNSVVAKVFYTGEVDRSELGLFKVEDGLEMEGAPTSESGELWDMARPLLGDCKLQLLKFQDGQDAKAVFWHSSAHIMGEAMEKKYGCHLTIGPPIQDGFYYDCYMGDSAISEGDFKDIEKIVGTMTKGKQRFERLVVSKEEALELFKYNPFKVSIISSKIPDGGYTTVYRNGELIDLCRGPHVVHTGRVKAFQTVKNSGTNWLGQTDNDALQRLYGISFPDKDQLKKWNHIQEQAREKDHRRVGLLQDLFFFHPLSPGSGFFTVHGARIYNKLTEFIREEYWKRGYTEVISPNLFNLDLWHISGHAEHYKSNMFILDVEGQEYGMKPMNCPGHCLMFGNKSRSWRDLPIRMAEFGVLHRNEISGALTGLTRVRRFVQDDSHIFCREDQVKTEVYECLQFMKFVYDTLGMSYRLDLSTRPEKAMGDIALWNQAEDQLRQALDEFAGPGGWNVNPGDGAFYGPKIDIKVFDALERQHQCATIQLDFQLPIRFKLRYRGGDVSGQDGDAEDDSKKAADDTPVDYSNPLESAGGDTLDSGFKRPIIVHRAMLGSLERMIAILTEHFGGKWPFWLSPRQALVVPVSKAFNEYGEAVKQRFHAAGFHVDLEGSNKTLNKKIREGQVAQYNFILVVGEKEQLSDSVNIRTRDNQVHGTKTVAETIALFQQHSREHTLNA